jgi:hypothetical protein
MRRLHSTRRLFLPAILVLAMVLPGCGVLDGEPSPTPTRTAAQGLGIEIAEARGSLMRDARDLVEQRPVAPEVKEALRLLGEQYKVLFGSYACVRDTLSAADRAVVAESFDANREAFLPDMTWLEDAASDYDTEDLDIRVSLEELRTLDDYAFLERLAKTRPGEELRCEG